MAEGVTRRKQGKPGELLLCIGIVCMLVAPFTMLLQGEADKQNAALREAGLVSTATVVAHSEQTESYSGRRGRTRTSTVSVLEVEHDLNSTTPYAQWEAEGTLIPTTYPAVTTSQIEVSESDLAELPLGAQTFVVSLPTDYSSLQLAERVRYEGSFAYHMLWWLAMAGLFGAGAVMTVMGWRKRRAHG